MPWNRPERVGQSGCLRFPNPLRNTKGIRATASHYNGFLTAAVGLIMLSGCAAAEGSPSDTTAVHSADDLAGSTPYNLYTHCGIHEALVDGTYFVADRRLDDGQGNPPPGWNNPYQAGVITVTGSQATFRDDAGHVVTFKARSGATGFLDVCS